MLDINDKNKDLVEYYLGYIKNNPIEKQEGHISVAILGSICDAVQPKYLSKYYDIDKLIKEKIESKGGIKTMKEEIEKLLKQVQENKKQVEEFKKTLSGEHQKLVDYIQLSMKLRDRRKEAIQKIVTLLTDALTELAHKKNLSYKEISHVHFSEIRNLTNPDFIEEVKKRKNGVVQLCQASGSIIKSTDFDKEREKINKTMLKKQSSLKGICASTGVAKGIVKIIKKAK